MNPLRFTAGGRTEVGHAPGGSQWQWPRNDDYLLIDSHLGLFLVLDGGGNWFGPDQRGRRGAEVIQQVIREEGATTAPQVLIERAFRIAGETLLTERDSDGDCGTSGVILALFHNGLVHVSWLGSEMAHRVSGERSEPLTWPHTARNAMLRAGALTEAVDTERGERLSYVLCHYLGSELPQPLEVISFTPNAGDRLILTTDGVHNVLLGSQFVAACQTHSEPQACAARLVELARERGSNDNCTAVVIAFEGSRDTIELGGATWPNHT